MICAYLAPSAIRGGYNRPGGDCQRHRDEDESWYAAQHIQLIVDDYQTKTFRYALQVSKAHKYRPLPLDFSSKKAPFNTPCNHIFPACKTKGVDCFICLHPFSITWAMTYMKRVAQTNARLSDHAGCTVNHSFSEMTEVIEGSWLTNGHCKPHLECFGRI